MPRITELYAWVIAEADPEDEGVPAFVTKEGVFMPLMGADIERAKNLRPIAQRFATQFGKPLKLIRSTSIEVVEEVQP